MKYTSAWNGESPPKAKPTMLVNTGKLAVLMVSSYGPTMGGVI